MFFVRYIKDGKIGIADSEDGVVEWYSRDDTFNIAKQVRIRGVLGDTITEYDYKDMIARDKTHGYETVYQFLRDKGLALSHVTTPQKCVVGVSNAVVILLGACFRNSLVERVILPKSVRHIYGDAFRHCLNLKSINLDYVTHIYNSAFYECSALTEVYLPNIQTIETATFRYCSSLRRVVAPRVSLIDACAFEGCTSLEQIQCDNLHSIGSYAFGGCTSLKNIRTKGSCKWEQTSFHNSSVTLTIY